MNQLISDILLVVSSCLISFSQIYVWSKFYSLKIEFKNVFLYLSLFCITCLGIFNYFYMNVFFRMIFVLLIFSFCNFLIFRRKINETIVSTIYGQALLTLADVIVSLFLIVILRVDSKTIREGFIMTYCGNFLVAVIYVIICRFPIIKQFYLKLISMTERITFKNLFFICLLVIVSINFIMVSTFYEVGSILVIIINSVLIFVYTFIVYKNISEKNSRLLVQAENVSLMESLHQYEDMVDRQRVDNHENKNQLLIIKNMIKKNDKDVVKYIDTVVKDEKEDDEALYTKVKSIPSGGLQGIIYQKMLSMKDNRILFSLDVSRDVRNIDLENMNMEDNYKLCKIVGVLLDNAIEESLKIDDKRIMISLYVDDDMLVIDISNRFDGNIDLDKIDEEGYTTKGDGHGYGLSLVKKLVSESNCFINERKVNNDVFKQIIKFKVK